MFLFFDDFTLLLSQNSVANHYNNDCLRCFPLPLPLSDFIVDWQNKYLSFYPAQVVQVNVTEKKTKHLVLLDRLSPLGFQDSRRSYLLSCFPDSSFFWLLSAQFALLHAPLVLPGNQILNTSSPFNFPFSYMIMSLFLSSETQHPHFHSQLSMFFFLLH